jgi:hypothetical protein
MLTHGHLLQLIDAYTKATNVEDKTLSFRVFGDSKKISALRGGADITVGRFNAAYRWFSDNWPGEAPWPHGVERPEPVEAQQ